MRKNYETIKAIINNLHSYSEMISGASECTRGSFNANAIKIKNDITTQLKTPAKTCSDIIQISNSSINAKLTTIGRLKKNDICVKNKIIHYVLIKVNLIKTNVMIVNSCKFIMAKALKSRQQDIVIKNECKNIVKIKLLLNKEKDFIENSLQHKLTISGKLDKQNVLIDNNSSVNAQTWYFVRLQAMSGSINAYYNQTIGDTGRRKVN